MLASALIVSVVNFTVWFAVTFWVYLETRSVLATGLIAGIFLVATASTGIWFGSLVDHHRKQYVLQASLAFCAATSRAWPVRNPRTPMTLSTPNWSCYSPPSARLPAPDVSTDRAASGAARPAGMISGVAQATSIRVVYSDLDGTMVGPRGSFWRAGDGSLTEQPAQVLAELHRAGIDLVLVSGRTRAQLTEAGRIFGADGFIAELGSVVAWKGWHQYEYLPGDLPPAYAGRPAFDVLTELGLPQALFDRYPGRLEWHSPWHTGHEVDAMLRGNVDVDEAEEWLAARGWPWLALRDNGVLPPSRPTGLQPEGLPPHIYHLMPRGLGKGVAVAWDLRRRGLSAADAIAIGDSASDLEMADAVATMWLTANGAAHEHVAQAAAVRPNVRISAAEVGLGWAEAVRSILPGPNLDAAGSEPEPAADSGS